MQKDKLCADMAELADAPALGAGVNDVGVQVPLSAPKKKEALRASIFLVCNKKERDLNGQEAAT